MASTLNSIQVGSGSTFYTANTLNITGDLTCSVSGNTVTLYGGTNKQGPPVGVVVFFAASTAPAGYLECNGAVISRTTYADLFKTIGTTFGEGDGVNTFSLPDIRGEFIRGWDHYRGVDYGRVFGSLQQDDFSSSVSNTQVPTGAGAYLLNARFGNETRPRNIALLPCICALATLDPSLDVASLAATKIDKPSSSTNGQVLTYNGGQWTAATLPTTTVAVVNEPATGLGTRGGTSYGGAYYTQNQIYLFGRQTIIDASDIRKLWPTRVRFMGNYMAKNPGVTIADVFYSYWNSFTLLSDGTLWGCGQSTYWQSTHTVTAGYSGMFIRIPMPGNRLVKSMSAACDANSYVTIAVICTDNTAWTWGYNPNGGLANGGTTASNTPVQLIVTGKTITQVAVGMHSTPGGTIHVLCSDGTLYASGYNAHGQLGIGTTTAVTVLTQCKTGPSTFIDRVTKIIDSPQNACYTRFVVRTAATGGQDELWATGLNDCGQLGITATPSGTSLSLFAMCSLPTTNTSGGLFKIKKVVVSGKSVNTSVCVLEDIVNNVGGRVYTWGYAAHGQLGLGVATNTNSPQQVTVFQSTPAGTTTLPQIKDIAASQPTSYGCLALISTAKDLYLSGYRSHGPITAFKTPGTYDGSIFYRFEMAPVANVEEVQFYCNETYNQAIYVRDSDGVIWIWGYNYYDAIVSTDNVYVYTPQRVNIN